MAETLLPAVGLVLATLLTGVATLLGVDRYRQKNGRQSSTVKIDSDQFERLIGAVNGVGGKVDGVSNHLAEAVADNRRQHDAQNNARQ